MGDENKKYVPEGVYLVCDKGSIPPQLLCDPQEINIYSVRFADVNDNKPTVNIPSFGVCKIKGTCEPPAGLTWTKFKTDVTLHGFHPLLEDSECICPVGGIIKIFFDKYEAELAAENNSESDFVSEPLSSSAIGQALLGPGIGQMVNMFAPSLTEGIGRGVKKGLEGTGSFLADAFWRKPGETWGGMLTGLGNMAVIGGVYASNATNPMGTFKSDMQLRALDARFNTNFTGTRDALVTGVAGAVEHSWENVKRGNVGEVGEDLGQIAYVGIEAVVGTKGAGFALKGLKTGAQVGANVAKGLVGAQRLAQIGAKSAQVLNRIKFALSGIVRVGRKAPKKYSTIDMKPDYVGEDIGEGWLRGSGDKVKYLTDAEREANELFIRNGKLYDAQGNLYDTSQAGTFWSGKGKSIFVMDENGRIFASSYQEPKVFHHSSLSQGKPVAGAGEIKVKNGEITEITNQSGHYKPKNNQQVLDKLKSEGVDTNNVKVNDIK